jgi:S1-C subfamily serine protease
MISDLALLKITPAHPLQPVCLFGGEKTASGERVAVIGNPGAGATTFDFATSEGTVSNPTQELAGQKFVQTTAPVIPGSGGGPMFDSHGLVVGVVELKARAEGAGLAIPAGDVVQFLAGCSSVKGDDGKLLRHWVDSMGTHQVNARFAGYAGYAPYGSNIVRLEKADGSLIRIHINKLSEADKRFLAIVKQGAAK